MDPEKILSQIKKALGLEDGATREQILKALDGIAALQEAREGKKDEPEAPEEPAEASRETEDAVAATAEPAEDAEVVEATAEVVEAAEEPAMDPLAGEALAAVGILAEASGMSPEEIIAALREKADAVVGALGGEPAAPAQEPAMSRAASDALKASKARIEAMEAARKKDAERMASLEKRLSERDSKDDERRIDDAIKAGHILPGHKSLFIALARSDRAEFDAQIKAAGEAPAVPTEDVATGKGSGPVADTVSEDDPELVHLAKTLRSAKVSEARIKVELAKAKAKNFEGRA